MGSKETIDELLEEQNLDAFLMIDKPLKNSDLYYILSIKIPDPVTFLKVPGKSVLMTSEKEKSRCEKKAEVDEIRTSSEFEAEGADRFEKLENFLDEYDVEKIGVDEENFNFGTAKKLEGNREIKPVENPITNSRKIKSRNEIEKLRRVQSITEEAMKKAEMVIKNSRVKNGKLMLKGEKLTSEKIKKHLERDLVSEKCRNMEGMIVTCGKESGEPHKRSSGVLKAKKPIIVDIFPRHRSMYFGDMTRTFVKGKPSQEIEDMHETVKKAQNKAFQYLEEATNRKAEELHNKVCEVIEKNNYGTLRQNSETGFIHSTGHGVGLDLHESPKLGPGVGKLEPGMVVTVEPGLYNPEAGGVRVEDMVLITEDGYKNFNSMHKQMEII